MSKRVYVRPVTRDLAEVVPLTPAEIDRVAGGTDPVEVPDDTVNWTWARRSDGTWYRSDGPY